MKSKHKSAKTRPSLNFLNYPLYIVVVLTLLVIPLSVRIIPVTYDMSVYSWFSDQTNFYDVFSLVKSRLVIVSGILSAIYLLAFFMTTSTWKWLIQDKVFIATELSVLFIVLSTLFSANPYASLNGYLERYESMWVFLSYILIFLGTYTFTWQKSHIKKIIWLFALCNLLLSVIGIFQYFGTDIVFSDFMKPLIVSSKMQGISFQTSKSFDYTAIYQTLYHSNYAGLFAAMSFPLFTTLFIRTQNTKERFFYLFLSLLIAFNLVGSISRGALIGGILSIPLIIFLNRKILFSNKRILITSVGVLFIAIIGLEVFTGGFMSTRFKQIMADTKFEPSLEQISVSKDLISIDYRENHMDIHILEHEGSTWNLSYELDGQFVAPSGNDSDGYLIFDMPSLKAFRIALLQYQSGESDLLVDIDNSNWIFGYQNGNLSYKNAYGKFDEIASPDTLGFSGNERLGSSRGYIWSRTLPLILASPIVGYGADSFPFVFPQNDYIGKFNAYNTTNMIVDKPHNLYLQIAFFFGIPALLLYFALFIILISRMVKSKPLADESSNDTDLLNGVSTGILAGIFAFSVSSIFTDSSVHVSPVFWTLFGLLMFLVSRKGESGIIK